MIDILTVLRSELANSRDEAQAREREVMRAQGHFKLAVDRIQQIQRLIEMYELEAKLRPDIGRNQETLPLPPSATVAAAPAPQETPSEATAEPAAEEPRAETKKARMFREIDNLLLAHGSYHRRKILDHLVRVGVMGHEKDPMVHLSIFLTSHRDRYVSDGAGNYRLRPPLRPRGSAGAPLSLEKATEIITGTPPQDSGREPGTVHGPEIGG